MLKLRPSYRRYSPELNLAAKSFRFCAGYCVRWKIPSHIKVLNIIVIIRCDKGPTPRGRQGTLSSCDTDATGQEARSGKDGIRDNAQGDCNATNPVRGVFLWFITTDV